MLVLSRKVGESLIIDDSIEIIPIRIDGKRIRIGIKAPKNIAVHRMEIYRKIKMEKKEKS